MKKIKLTKEMLREWGACSLGYEWYLKQDSDDAIAILKSLIKENQWGWFYWTVARLMSHRQKVQWAVFCAEQVIEIFEKKYPEDKRPRQAIEAAKAWLDNPSEENTNAASAAHCAARCAAYAAYCAAYAAHAAYDAHAAYAAYAADASMRVTCANKAIQIIKKGSK